MSPPRVLLALAAAVAGASAASIAIPPRAASVPGVLSFPVVYGDKATLIHRKRAADTDAPVLNVSSTSYLIKREHFPVSLLQLSFPGLPDRLGDARGRRQEPRTLDR